MAHDFKVATINDSFYFFPCIMLSGFHPKMHIILISLHHPNFPLTLKKNVYDSCIYDSCIYKNTLYFYEDMFGLVQVFHLLTSECKT